MEAQDQEMIIKKKRTKRPRLASPLSLTMAPTSSCSGAGSEGDDHISHRAIAFPSSSGGLAQSAQEDDEDEKEEEEEDMANCLILLAQGCHQQKSSKNHQTVNLATHKAAASDVYQCKTCNRCFPSFQALGGHRASHKKTKPTQEEQIEGSLQRMIGLTGVSPAPRKQALLDMEQQPVQSMEETTALSLQITTRTLCSNSNSNSKLRVHECSICGAEFSSGQALGGHMRRHRPIPMVNSHVQEESSQEVKKPRAMLSLDLNLPAPEDDHHQQHHQESKFPFAAKEQVIVFSASPLVDCHY